MRTLIAALMLITPIAANAAEKNIFDDLKYSMGGMLSGSMTYHAFNCQLNVEKKKTFDELKALVIGPTLKDGKITESQRKVYMDAFERGVKETKRAFSR